MQRGKWAPGVSKLPLKEGMLPRADDATQFRRSLTDRFDIAKPELLLNRALSYAAEAEQRIVELSARIAQLENMTVTDEMTGLLNRRGFNATLHRNLLSAARYDEVGILAYLDLDGFKAVNDRHGHAVGDKVLRAVGRYIQQNIRATDYAARLGGDEFAILFVRATQVPARERARQLARGINKLTIACPTGRIAVRTSLGLVSYDGSTDAPALLERADRAMYADKNKGSRVARMIVNG